MIQRLSAALAGRYAVSRELGAGGMATVFLARDVRHDRDVAVKVLHEDLGTALGAERFLAEIRTTARLQHPHILPLLDSGDADGLLFYVMPFVRGETLRGRLERERQLPIPDALLIAREVADALGAAHAQGIVHRDIKPENILLQDGHALVADFGIALAVQQAGGARLTQTGLSLGTPAYMSPEQAMGERTLDARADLYALGAVTYEMLSGEPPFTGASVQAIVARLLSERPTPLATLRDTVPAHVDAAVRQCLAKLPADRFATAAEFSRALEVSGAAAARVPGMSDDQRRGRRFSLGTMAAIGAATLAAGLGIGGWVSLRVAEPRASAVPVRFEIDPPPGSTLTTPRGGQPVLAISADGNTIVFSASGPSGSMLYRRTVGDLVAKPIPGTDLADAAAFSPNGKWLAISAKGKITRLATDGSASDVLVEIEGSGTVGMTWVSNEELVFTQNSLTEARRGLRIVRAPGGEARSFTQPYDTTGNPLALFLAPVSAGDGEHVLFAAAPTGVLFLRIGITSVRTGKSRLIDGIQGSAPLGMVGDRIVYVRGDGALLAARLDLSTAKATEPVVLSDAVEITNYWVGGALSRSGSLVIAGSGQRELVRVTADGSATPLLAATGSYMHPRLSPDASRLAFDDRDAKGAFLRVTDLRSGATDRTAVDDAGSRAEWTPDGSRLLYPTGGVGTASGNVVRIRRADGASGGEDLFQAKSLLREVVMTPDGRALVFRVDHPTTGRDLWLLDLATKQETPLAVSPADERQPRVSPDGRWLAYVSDESGDAMVYLRPLRGTTGRTTVSAGPGSEPVWSRDGTRVFYRVGSAVMEATVASGDPPRVTTRRQLFDGRYETDPFHASYDVFPDGRTFVMVRAVADSRRVVLVRDWQEELAARVTSR